jgi:hypothetical protein
VLAKQGIEAQFAQFAYLGAEFKHKTRVIVASILHLGTTGHDCTCLTKQFPSQKLVPFPRYTLLNIRQYRPPLLCGS